MFDVHPAANSEAPSLGARLASAREARGLPIEQVAHETRIRAQRIREIESGDFSHFAHPSYARFFLTDYARYLGIPLAEIRDFLPAPGACGAGGYQYLEGIEDAPRVRTRGPKTIRSRGGQAVLAGLATIACLFLALFGWITLRKIDRLNLNRPAEAVVAPVAPKLPQPEVAPAPVNPPENVQATVVPIDQMSDPEISDNPAPAANAPEAPVLSATDNTVPVVSLTMPSSVKNSLSLTTSASNSTVIPQPAPSSTGQSDAASLLVGGRVEHGASVQ